MKFSSIKINLSIFIFSLLAIPFISSGQSAVSVSNNDNISEEEKEMLIRGYSEEKLARDVYTYLDGIYDIAIFLNITPAEQRHVEVMEGLLKTYNIEVPTGYGPYEKELIDLKAKGNKSLKDALEVGLMIEILDIEDLDKTIASTKNKMIYNSYTNLRKASVNHLNAFARSMNNNSFATDLNWQQYAGTDISQKKGNKMSKQMKGHGNSNMTQKKAKSNCSPSCPKINSCKKG